MDEWRLCVCVGLIGGFQTKAHSSTTENPVLTLQHSCTHACTYTRTFSHAPPPLIFEAQSVPKKGNKCVCVCVCAQTDSHSVTLCVSVYA